MEILPPRYDLLIEMGFSQPQTLINVMVLVPPHLTTKSRWGFPPHFDLSLKMGISQPQTLGLFV